MRRRAVPDGRRDRRARGRARSGRRRDPIFGCADRRAFRHPDLLPAPRAAQQRQGGARLSAAAGLSAARVRADPGDGEGTQDRPRAGHHRAVSGGERSNAGEFFARHALLRARWRRRPQHRVDGAAAHCGGQDCAAAAGAGAGAARAGRTTRRDRDTATRAARRGLRGAANARRGRGAGARADLRCTRGAARKDAGAGDQPAEPDPGVAPQQADGARASIDRRGARARMGRSTRRAPSTSSI